MARIKSNKNRHYDWVVYPDSYLASALILANQIPYWVTQKDIVMGNEIFKKLNFRSHHPNYEFIYPIIYNLKHGVELYLKGLSNIDYGEYNYGHNLKSIFNLLILDSKNNNNNYTVIKKLHNDTWPIIAKYYYGTYIPLIKDNKHPDKYNEAERYPERKSVKMKDRKNGVYRIPDGYKWVTGAIVDQVKRDIEFLENKFSQAKRKIKPSKKFHY